MGAAGRERQAASKQRGSLSKTSPGGEGPRLFLRILQTGDTDRPSGALWVLLLDQDFCTGGFHF